MMCRPIWAWVWALRALVVVIATVSVYACGAGSSDEGATEQPDPKAEKVLNPIGDRPEISAWTRPNSEYAYDEFIEAGWKERQVYDVATLPSALEARYGFFNRRDVEIRRYASHAVAIAAGAAAAEDALDRTVHDGSGFRSRRVYGGYLVAGNLVMMCEFSTDDCLDLIETAESVASE